MSHTALARFAGVLALALVFIGPFALVIVPGALHVPGDPEATRAALVEAPTFFRAGLGAEAAIVLIEIVLTAVLWALFRKVSPWLAATATIARAVMTTLQGVGLLVGIALAIGLPDLDAGTVAFAFSLRLATILTWQIAFAAHCVALGVLVWRSGFLPRVLGPLMVLAGLGYGLHTLVSVALPEGSGVAEVVVAITAIGGELPLFLWMLVRGVRAGR